MFQSKKNSPAPPRTHHPRAVFEILEGLHLCLPRTLLCNFLSLLIRMLPCSRQAYYQGGLQRPSRRNIDRIERNIEPIELNALTPALKSNVFVVILCRVDLRISLSEAKLNAEADFDVHSAVAPPKPHQVDEKLTFRSEIFSN